MPKSKPHNGLKKRVKVTARGKLVRQKSFAGHLMSRKSGNRCRQLRRKALLVGNIAENVKRALALK